MAENRTDCALKDASLPASDSPRPRKPASPAGRQRVECGALTHRHLSRRLAQAEPATRFWAGSDLCHRGADEL